MKKIRHIFLLFVAGTMFVLGGCSNMPVHFGQPENYPASNDYRLIDDPAPDEELCTLVIDGTLTLRRMEGADRRWGGSYFSTSGYSLRIAAGKRTLTFDYTSWSSTTRGQWYITTTSSANGIGTTYEFEPGRTYRVYPMIDNAKNSVAVEITETSFPVQLGWRMGPYLGWQQGMANAPLAGLFAIAQVGVVVTAGDLSMEFLAEANGGLGYSPFKKDSPIYDEDGDDFVSSIDGNVQAGGTANFYFGKSLKKIGLGFGGGVSVGNDGSDVVPIPYLRASFLPYSGDFWNHIRLFVDYSFTQEDAWKRFGLGVIFFL